MEDDFQGEDEEELFDTQVHSGDHNQAQIAKIRADSKQPDADANRPASDQAAGDAEDALLDAVVLLVSHKLEKAGKGMADIPQDELESFV